MKGAILEIFLVSAEGIAGTSLLGNAAYHIELECGSHMLKSKTSSESLDKIYWNEKFTFRMLQSEVETLSHLKLKIVSEEYLFDDQFVGEVMIFLKGIIVEGGYRRVIELNPTPFNVVLEDGTYQGQLTLGLKFIPSLNLDRSNHVIVPLREMESKKEEKEVGEGNGSWIYGQIKWWKHIFSCGN